MKSISLIKQFLKNDQKTIILGFALVLIGFAFFNPALRFLPVDFDDLVLLSNAKNTANPLTFFVGDWGFGNYGYRPIHSFSLWLGYLAFGVSSGPNQLLNLMLHLIIILLLFMLLLKIQKNEVVAFIFSAISLVSLYTFSPPTWISDRPTLLVAICLLICLNYLFTRGKAQKTSVPILVLLSALALASKESGLLVPAICAFHLFLNGKDSPNQKQAIIGLFAVMFLYGMLRYSLFGTSAGSYDEAGYLFGLRYYPSINELTSTQRFLSYLDNVIKNVMALFLPVFDGQGKLSLIGTLLNSIILAGTTFLLTILAFTKKLSRKQLLALGIILLNALLHFQVFRYRTLYLGHIGFTVFLAGSKLFLDEKSTRKLVAFIAAALLVLWSIHVVGEDLTYIYIDRYNLLRQPHFESWILSTSNRIDPEIVRSIIAKYRH